MRSSWLLTLIVASCALFLGGCGLLMLPFQAVGTLIHGPGDTIIVDQNSRRQDDMRGPINQAEIMRSSVVRLRCDSTDRTRTGFLHSTATIITAAHFVSRCETASIVGVLPDGTRFGVSKAIKDIPLDVAVLYPDINLDGRSVILLSRENSIALSAPVVVWGFPDGISGTEPIVTAATVSGLDRKPMYDNNGRLAYRSTGLWIIDGSINAGHSGSPVIRLSDGIIVGMIITKSQRSEGIGYALPSERILDFLKRSNVMR